MIARTYQPLVVKDIRKETEDCVSIAFEIPSELQEHYQFKSGQYLNFKLNIDGEEVRRSYSLSSSPHENEWRIAVKQVENGKFSNYINNQLKVNDVIEVMTPIGTFTTEFNENNAKEYVLVAAGSGITPVISLAKTMLKKEPNSQVTLFFGNKGTNSIIFREQIEGLKNKYMTNFRVFHIFSREDLGYPLQQGRIDAEKFKQLLDSFCKGQTIDDVFICGPEEMIKNVQQVSLDFGVKKEGVHVELFSTNVPTDSERKIEEENQKDQPNIQTEVTVIIDDDTFHYTMNSDQNILDAGIEAGLDLPYSCKGGVCCTCRGKVLEGEVRMDVNYALNDDEVERGYVLTCQSHPTTATVVVSYDD